MPSKEAPEHLPVVLVIEGGPKYIKFFKNLLMRRIDWTAKRGKKQEATNESISDELEDPGEGNEHCSLVWEGIITDHIFPKWTIKEVHNELEARRHFADRGVEEYWEMVLNKARRS
jgi:U4/U6 small nuclear ribonucleoprotein PRP3